MAIDSLSKYRAAVDGVKNKAKVTGSKGEEHEVERLPIRRGDGWKVDPLLLLEEEGYNARGAFAVDYWNRPDVIAHIRGFAESYKAGRSVPPITVEVRDGDIYVRDGAHRRRGLLLALQEGAQIELVEVVESKGDEVEQAKLVLTANDGRPLTRLERAVQYGKFQKWGWTIGAIAKEFNRTHEHVRSTLPLLDLPFELKQMIAEDVCSASLALDVYDQHGTKAVEIIKNAANQKGDQSQAEEDKVLELALGGLTEGLGNSEQAPSSDVDSQSSEPETPAAPAQPPRKPRVTSKDLNKAGPKISKKTVHFVHKSFETLQKSIDNISRENDYFVMKLSADEVELLKQMKSQLAASGGSVDPQQPEKNTAQTDMVDQLDGQNQVDASAQ
ncbi:hypothetical protein SJI00_20630 [Pseudomonas sp. RP23018S]|uniref:hypothetical protein n=1 Tax=Pseudomonas sp. RP23018S TaxID=3096037 RepID=UPI002AC9F3D6|nr:hypothetical protein [Pseudomonas sp. RP23018S]MDZ5605181.1 hypothetical protein [Pseudomonas sp. RP23018S]